jgi:hypothetical protein
MQLKIAIAIRTEFTVGSHDHAIVVCMPGKYLPLAIGGKYYEPFNSATAARR